MFAGLALFLAFVAAVYFVPWTVAQLLNFLAEHPEFGEAYGSFFLGFMTFAPIVFVPALNRMRLKERDGFMRFLVVLIMISCALSSALFQAGSYLGHVVVPIGAVLWAFEAGTAFGAITVAFVSVYEVLRFQSGMGDTGRN